MPYINLSIILCCCFFREAVLFVCVFFVVFCCCFFLVHVLSQVFLNSGVTSCYASDQSMSSISDMKKTLGGEAKQNPWDSMYNNLFDIYQQKLNIVIKITPGPC